VTTKQRHKEVWTEDRRQYVVEQLAKGRTIPDIARELYVAPATLRSAMRYYGQIEKKPTEKDNARA